MKKKKDQVVKKKNKRYYKINNFLKLQMLTNYQL